MYNKAVFLYIVIAERVATPAVAASGSRSRTQRRDSWALTIREIISVCLEYSLSHFPIMLYTKPAHKSSAIRNWWTWKMDFTDAKSATENILTTNIEYSFQ